MSVYVIVVLILIAIFLTAAVMALIFDRELMYLRRENHAPAAVLGAGQAALDESGRLHRHAPGSTAEPNFQPISKQKPTLLRKFNKYYNSWKCLP